MSQSTSLDLNYFYDSQSQNCVKSHHTDMKNMISGSVWLKPPEDIIISQVHYEYTAINLLRTQRKKDTSHSRTCLRMIAFLCFSSIKVLMDNLADF